MFDFLKEAKAVGIPLAVVTGETTKKTEEAFRQVSILKYFVKIVGGDRTTSAKPAPQVVNILINELSVLKEKSVMIGDRPVDIETGINAGLKHHVAVLTGLGEKSDFESYPCEIVNSLEEIVISHD